jgi:hypothetical protein
MDRDLADINTLKLCVRHVRFVSKAVGLARKKQEPK